ncbi:MAG TPA: hypothetical protein VF218_00275 [Acidothermaceae bacterium]|jgi:hypothetical protein
MSSHTTPPVPIDVPAVEEESEFDAVEQQTEVVDVTVAPDDAPLEPALDDDRVVPLDEDEYR